ncbi:MAG: recombination protein RecR [Candidatus Kerfeldbacteria bacterium]|nr:recombination protein RecR [Candidatus Kerfeldbacteria bacterium]
MARYPATIEQLITAFMALPGVGRKTAERYVVYLLKQPPEVVGQLVATLTSAQQAVRLCERCFNFSNGKLCDICQSSQRDQTTVCVVSDGTAVAALEQAAGYHGTYHILGGTINQLEGIGPDQLHIKELVERVKQQAVTEVILGTNPDMTGEATALYVIDALKDSGVLVTRLARGLSAGSDIEYADDITLSSALENRKAV